MDCTIAPVFMHGKEGRRAILMGLGDGMMCIRGMEVKLLE